MGIVHGAGARGGEHGLARQRVPPGEPVAGHRDEPGGLEEVQPSGTRGEHRREVAGALGRGEQQQLPRGRRQRGDALAVDGVEPLRHRQGTAGTSPPSAAGSSTSASGLPAAAARTVARAAGCGACSSSSAAAAASSSGAEHPLRQVEPRPVVADRCDERHALGPPAAARRRRARRATARRATGRRRSARPPAPRRPAPPAARRRPGAGPAPGRPRGRAPARAVPARGATAAAGAGRRRRARPRPGYRWPAGRPARPPARRASSSSAVLPSPGAPRSTSAPPRPSRASSRRAPSAACSSSRPCSTCRSFRTRRAGATRLYVRNGPYPGQHCGSRRPHADGPAAAPRPRRVRRAGLREARDVQPGRLRQGPHRRGHDRGGRGRGPDRARAHHDRRGDERQHRDRARLRLRRQGLRPDPHAAAGHEPRARGAAAPLRRDRAGDGVDGRDERGRRRGPGAGARLGRLAPRPVLQPREPARPLHGHRPGDLGGDGRARSTASSRASAPAAR